ncbi:MAG TPA: PilZ domain-containing protein [Gemmataceae bacterium]|nr:PilZ domain-containing protein [Gemmataceae bacterium]
MNSPFPASNGAVQPPERRVAPRYQPAYGTVCQLEEIGASDSTFVGLVWNISKTGMSMLVGSPSKAGSELPGKLSTEAGKHTLAVVLRVIHIRLIQTGDYFVGAQFASPLKAEEMQFFLLPEQRNRAM